MKFEGLSVSLFLKYLLASLGTFGLNLLIIWLLGSVIGIYYLLAVTVGFFVETTTLYILNRIWTFHGVVQTTVHGGYARAWLVALSTLMLILALEWLFVDIFFVQYILARVLIAPFAYSWSLLWDGTFTFRALKYVPLKQKPPFEADSAD